VRCLHGVINAPPSDRALSPTSSVRGEITTLEGLAKDGKLTRSSRRGSTSRFPQCGFCQNGQIMTAKALLDKNPHPQTDEQIRQGMAGTLCRCMTYFRIQTRSARCRRTV